jgi:oligoribonuclease NrnB/cAMP/cGMP phosphodiesterase (DHH superfamily)
LKNTIEYTHVLYHAGCPDGFGAAYAAWKRFGDKAQYIPINHGDPFPALPENADVLMVDAAYPRARHLELVSKVKSLMVVDHHKSAMADIGDLPNTHFDMGHSGAVLAWQHLHDDLTPTLLKYIEDRDLWRFGLPDSKEVSAALSAYPMKFELWGSFNVRDLAVEGVAILRLKSQKVEEMAERAFWGRVAGHDVLIVNTTVFGSEVGNELCKAHPTMPFAAYFFEKKGLRCWGLRSVGDFDVSEVAKKFGGGGHKNAAGFTQPIGGIDI